MLRRLIITFAIAAGLCIAQRDAMAQMATATTAALASAEPVEAELQGDFRAHDPSLFMLPAGDWFVFATGPGVQRLRSHDGRRWERLAPVFTAQTRPAWWAQAVPAHREGMDVWAPKLFQQGGRYRLLYSISTFGKNTSAIGMASAESPDAALWRDDGLVLQSGPGDAFNAIDPDGFVDADGRVWLTFGSFWSGIRLTELDAQTLKPKGEAHFVARNAGGIEAPTLTRRGDWYYLWVSWGLCCRGVASTYNIRVGRSHSPNGPFVDRDGRAMLDGGGTLIEAGGVRWKGPGHQDVFGNFLVRHAYDAQDSGHPYLRVNELKWSEDGWPGL